MTEPWLLYLLIFGLVAVAVLLLQRGVGGVNRQRRDKRKRYASLDPAETGEIEALRRRASRFSTLPLVAGASRLIMQSGTTFGASTLGGVVLGLALLLWLLMPATLGAGLRALVAAAISITAVWLWLRIQRVRRMARFGEQLPEVIDVIVRSLRAGHPLAVSLNLVAREMPEPAGTEFTLVVDEVSYGRSLSEALDNLYERVGYPELRFFVASTAIAHQTGGNLGEILSRLSRLLRERFRLARRVRALSAEGRFSGLALSILPVALFGVINILSASYYADFWTSGAATPVVAICVALLLLGNLVIFRLVNFKV